MNTKPEWPISLTAYRVSREVQYLAAVTRYHTSWWSAGRCLDLVRVGTRMSTWGEQLRELNDLKKAAAAMTTVTWSLGAP